MPSCRVEVHGVFVTVDFTLSNSHKSSWILSEAIKKYQAVKPKESRKKEPLVGLFNVSRNSDINPESEICSSIRDGDFLLGREFIAYSENQEDSEQANSQLKDSIKHTSDPLVYQVSFTEGKVGLALETDIHDLKRTNFPDIIVKTLSGQAKNCKRIEVGDCLLAVNEITVSNSPFNHVMSLLRSAHRPLVLTFRKKIRSSKRDENGVLATPKCGHIYEESFANEIVGYMNIENDNNMLRSISESSCNMEETESQKAVVSENFGEISSNVATEESLTDDDYDSDEDRSNNTKESNKMNSSFSSFFRHQSSKKTAKDHLQEIRAASLTTSTSTPVATVLTNIENNQAAALVNWKSCLSANNYELFYSKDWPVKVWRKFDGKISQCSRRPNYHSTTVKGLELDKKYVFRIRCGINQTTWGEFSECSNSIQTPQQKKFDSQKQKSCTSPSSRSSALNLVRRNSPKGSGWGYSNSCVFFTSQQQKPPLLSSSIDNPKTGLIVSWKEIPGATTYEIQYARNNSFKQMRNWKIYSCVKPSACKLKLIPNGSAFGENIELFQYEIDGLRSGVEYIVRIKAGIVIQKQSNEEVERIDWDESGHSPISLPMRTKETEEERELREAKALRTKAAFDAMNNMKQRIAANATAAGEKAHIHLKSSLLSKPFTVQIPRSDRLGIRLKEDIHGFVVIGFERKVDGTIKDAEASGRIKVGDILVGLNEVDFTSECDTEALKTAILNINDGPIRGFHSLQLRRGPVLLSPKKKPVCSATSNSPTKGARKRSFLTSGKLKSFSSSNINHNQSMKTL